MGPLAHDLRVPDGARAATQDAELPVADLAAVAVRAMKNARHLRPFRRANGRPNHPPAGPRGVPTGAVDQRCATTVVTVGSAFGSPLRRDRAQTLRPATVATAAAPLPSARLRKRAMDARCGGSAADRRHARRMTSCFLGTAPNGCALFGDSVVAWLAGPVQTHPETRMVIHQDEATLFG